MNRIDKFCAFLLTLSIILSFTFLFVGVSQIPESLTKQEMTDPSTEILYTMEEQRAALAKKVIASDGFKTTMIACGCIGGITFTFLGVCIYRRLYPRESSVVGVAPYTLESAPFPPHNIAGMQLQSRGVDTPRASPEPAV